MVIRKHNTMGKVLYWIGFLLFIMGFLFDDRISLIQDAPEQLSNYSLPAIILGIVIIISSNFFRK
jgi:hypothetical protein